MAFLCPTKVNTVCCRMRREVKVTRVVQFSWSNILFTAELNLWKGSYEITKDGHHHLVRLKWEAPKTVCACSLQILDLTRLPHVILCLVCGPSSTLASLSSIPHPHTNQYTFTLVPEARTNLGHVTTCTCF